MAVIPLHADYEPTVTTAGHSLAYKSQRKTMNRGEKNREGGKRKGKHGEEKKAER
jgi:hypothetical protein